jgi:hypothetical protein
MKAGLWIAIVAVLGLAACNYTDGACWPVGQGGQGNAGVGSGVVMPSGAGGLGDGPQGSGTAGPACNSMSQAPATPGSAAGSQANKCADTAGSEGGGTATNGDTYSFCSGPCSGKCFIGGVFHFHPSIFKFVTIVADDGKDKGGGWQEAIVNLKIRRWIGWAPESWSCPLKIGTPLRSEANGKISPEIAASASAEVATEASDAIMTSSPSIPQGIFCSLLKGQMNGMLNKIIAGAKVELP